MAGVLSVGESKRRGKFQRTDVSRTHKERLKQEIDGNDTTSESKHTDK